MKICSAFLIAVMLLSGQPAPARALACGKTYTVRAGETLYSIAKLCNISYVVLMGINYEISDPGKIYPGQVIRLEAEAPLEQYHQPAAGPADTAGYQPGGAYIVRKGDSLSRIAYLYGTTITELVHYNPVLLQNAIIVPGQVLLLPPYTRHEKGWVGVSSIAAEGGDQIQVRVVDFPAYSFLELHLTLREEEDYNYDVIQLKTDSRGEARGTMLLPWYAYKGEVYEIHVFNLDEPEMGEVKSPGIKIID